METSDLEKLAKWSAPKEVQTKFGPRIFRKSPVTQEFSAAWKTQKDALKALGASFSKNQMGEWELSWWQELPKSVIAQRAESAVASRAAKAEIDLPRPAGCDYLPFQKAGIQYALARKNVLIADEMGLGKTIQAIGIINADPTITTAIIVCPKSLKLNWLRELQKWLVRPLTVATVDGAFPSADIVIINYEALGKWADQISARTWGLCVCDEAHLIKNAKTQRSRNVKAIQAVRHVRLTGTPIVNRPVELYNIIADLAPEQFGTFFAFARRYANASQTKFGWDFSGASNLDELQRRLRETIMVRRLKADVLTELPAKIRQIIEIEAETAEQKRAVRRESAYEDESAERLANLRAAVELSKAESEEAYHTAVDALTDAAQVSFSEMSRLRHDTAKSKIPAVLAHVQQCLEDNDQKLVVAAHHIDVVEALMTGLSEFSPVKLIGGMSEADRQSSVDTFQTSPKCRVFVAGITAAGVGITLTAASHMVFAELDWVPGNVTQMEDREHRIGQTDTVLIQHLVLADSLDARMAKVLVEKQTVIEQALDKNHPARVQPVYVPKQSAASADQNVQQISKEADDLSAEQVAEIHAKLRQLAGLDFDHATALNGEGFNKIDTVIGCSLAQQPSLSPKQAVIGKKIASKYHRQVGKLSWMEEKS